MLVELHAFPSNWPVAPFDYLAAGRFEQARAGGVRGTSMDLNFASIALVNDGLVLTADLQKFRKVAGRRVENWFR